MTELRNLYGGAIQAYLPPDSCDISELRQVPDNQEVFAHPKSDQSIIFDILEYVESVSDEEAAVYHFRDLIGDQKSTGDAAPLASDLVKSVQKLNLSPLNCTSVYYLHGQNFVSKYKESAKNLVDLHLALFRFKNYHTDILITFNDPAYINPESSSFDTATAACQDQLKWNLNDFMKIVQTFRVLDFGLFVN